MTETTAMNDDRTVIIDQGLSGDAFAAGVPHAHFARLRREEPISRLRLPDGTLAWSVVRYGDVSASLRDLPEFQTASVDVPTTCPLHDIDADGPDEVDTDTPIDDERWRVRGVMVLAPPDHSASRRRLTWLRRRDLLAAARLEVRELAHSAVGAALDHGSVDIVEHFAAPAAASVVGSFLRIDPKNWPYLQRLSSVFMGDTLLPPEVAPLRDLALGPLSINSVGGSPGRAAMDLVADAWGHAPWLDPDFVEHADRWEREDLGGQMLAAGVAGLRNSLVYAVHLLAPRWHEIRTDSQRWQDALPLVADEVLRHATPLLRTRRILRDDITMHNCHMQAGETVVLWLASANFDDEVFTDPLTFEPFRRENPHLSFSVGPHRCLGAAMARMQVEEFVSAAMQRWQSVEQLGPPVRFPSNVVNEVMHLPMRLE